MNIVALTTEGPTSHYLINELDKQYPVRKVFFEQGRAESNYWAKLKKVTNLKKVKGHGRHLLERILFRKERLSRRAYEGKNCPPSLRSTVRCERVASLNSRETIERIKEEEPDLIVVQGTQILRRDVLEIARTETINLHPGIVPEYRGGGLPYWVFYNRDFGNLGITIHVCTNELDGGPILGQARYRLQREDRIYMMNYKMSVLFVELLKHVIERFVDGSIRYQQQGPGGKVWRKRDLTIVKQLLARRRFDKYVKSLPPAEIGGMCPESRGKVLA